MKPKNTIYAAVLMTVVISFSPAFVYGAGWGSSTPASMDEIIDFGTTYTTRSDRFSAPCTVTMAFRPEDNEDQPDWFVGVLPYSIILREGIGADVTYTIDRSKLSPGLNEWELDWYASWYDDGVQIGHEIQTIRAVVPTAPNLTVTPLTYNFGANGTTTTITVKNNGEYCNILNWTASDNASWMSVSPTSGSLAADATANVTVTINRAGRDGTYNGTVNFGGNGGSRSVSISMKALTIEGYVRHGDGAGIPGVNVSCGAGSDDTDADGYYKILGLANGEHLLTVSGLGYEYSPSSDHNGTITLSGSNVLDIDFYTYTINGHVTRYNEEPASAGVADITVNIKKDGLSKASITTDEDGYYEKIGLPEGTYDVEAANPE